MLFDSVGELDCYESELLERELKVYSSDPEDEAKLADEFLNKALENPNDVGCLVEKGEPKHQYELNNTSIDYECQTTFRL